MSSNQRPAGPLPPQVYRRRRLAVLLGLLAVIVVVVLIIVRPGAADDTPVADAGASPTAEAPDDAATEDVADDTADDGTCRTQNVSIEAVTDKDAYGSGELPQISMRLTNVGATPCILDVTPSTQIYEVGSGADAYWLSSDCQEPAEQLLVTLAPNEPQSTTPLGWDRTRSLPCDTSTQQVPAADATYYLQVRLGELESAKTSFRLL